MRSGYRCRLFLLPILLVHTSFRQPVFLPDDFFAYTAPKGKCTIRLYWKDDQGHQLRNIGRLKSLLEEKGQTLLFAMNAGMFHEDRSPVGLYIENGKTLGKLVRGNGSGNFFLKPNGVFLVRNNGQATIVTTEHFKAAKDIRYATQSGPMLLINGQYHPAFNSSSSNLNIRNGIGILPDGSVLMAISKLPMSFYQFANFFKSKGCRQALYLDGSISRAYQKDSNTQETDGNLGVLLGVTP